MELNNNKSIDETRETFIEYAKRGGRVLPSNLTLRVSRKKVDTGR